MGNYLSTHWITISESINEKDLKELPQEVVTWTKDFAYHIYINKLLNPWVVCKSTLLVASIPVTYHLYYFIWYAVRMRRNAVQINKLPGKPRHWLKGNLYDNPGPGPEIIPYIMDIVRQYPRAFYYWYGPLLGFAGVCHPDTVKAVLKTAEPKFTDKSAAYSYFLPWLGEGLILAAGPLWFRHRKLLTPAFHFDILKGYVAVYNDCTDILLSKIDSRVDTDIDVQELVTLCTLDIILRCAFSYDIDVQEQGKNHPYVIAVRDLTELLVKRTFNVFYRASDLLYSLTRNGRTVNRHCKYVHQVADDIIWQRRQTLEAQGYEADISDKKKYLDFLDIMLTMRDDNGKGLTDPEIRNQVDTFLFAGHDTTSTCISWTLYAFAQHPEIQEKVCQEIMTEIGDRSNIQPDDYSKLPYLTMCIKESQRVFTPVPIINRQLSEPLDIDGVTLNPGTIIDVHLYGLHHNPIVWGEDCEEFKPDRFHPDRIAQMDPHAFVPFSSGPRNCIGQNFAINEIKTVLVKILQRFQVLAVEGHDPGIEPFVVLRAKYGIKLRFKHRH